MKKGADRTEDTIIPRERKMRIKEVVENG